MEMKDKVLIPMKGDYGHLFKRLEDIGLEVCNDSIGAITDPMEKIEKLKQFKYIVTGGERWQEELLHKIQGKLKMIVKYGSGVDNIDLECARKLGIAVSNTAGRNSFAVAELAVAFMLDIARGITRYDGIVKNGGWDGLRGFSMSGKVIGFLGFGAIAGDVAVRLANFGVKMIAFDKFQNIERARHLKVEFVSLEELLTTSDIISIHIPLMEETKGMMNMNAFRKMKPGAYIVNTSRGPIIHEVDLVEALKKGVIAGAALDVYETEPLPEESELRGLVNAILTPHIAAATDEAGMSMLTGCVENIIAFEQGIFVNVVNGL